MPSPILSVTLPNYGSFYDEHGFAGLVQVARAAEEAGFGRVVVVDHVVMGPNVDAYQWGRFPTPPDGPWLEPLTVLTAIAMATTRIRLGTGILIAPLRGAALLAKTAATLDVLSGGRLDLGVGTGWQQEEYAAAGLDFAQRGQLLSDTMAACKALWTSSPAAVDLPTVTFSETWCSPQPVQPGGVPLWASGTLLRSVEERIVRWGDGWIPIMTATLDVLRAPDKRVDVAATLAQVPQLLDAGVTDVHIALQALSRDPGKVAPLMQELSAGFTDLVSSRAGTPLTR